MAKYYCEYCGTSYISLSVLTSATCKNSPKGIHKGKHKLYQGNEKSQYICKNCGVKKSSLASLTNGSCKNHPNGIHKGKHLPM